MKNFFAKVLTSVLGFGVTTTWAYQTSTHADISKYAAEQSIINQPSSGVLSSLGLGLNAADSDFPLPSTSAPFGFPLPLTPRYLIMQGARDEDRGFRSLRHFFDPQRSGNGIPTFKSSPQWALAPPNSIAEQTFSYPDAKVYLLNALTRSSKGERDKNLGLVFETLGHVIHHI